MTAAGLEARNIAKSHEYLEICTSFANLKTGEFQARGYLRWARPILAFSFREVIKRPFPRKISAGFPRLTFQIRPKVYLHVFLVKK